MTEPFRRAGRCAILIGERLDLLVLVLDPLHMDHVVERSVAGGFKIFAIALLNHPTVGHDIYEVARRDRRQVVGDDDGRPVVSPCLDRLMDKHTRGRIESRSRFVYGRRWKEGVSESHGSREEESNDRPRIRTVGFRMYARAIASRCRCPPERLAPRSPLRGVS